MQVTLERDPTIREATQPRRRHHWRRQLQAKARGAVLSALVLFVLLQAGTAVIVEEWPELRDPVFEIKYRRLTRLIGAHTQPPATVVFLGSSMTANGMKADMVDEPLTAALSRPTIGFNLGANGAGPVAQLVYLQRLLRRGVRPDLVVVELSPLFSDAGQAQFDVHRFPANVLEHDDLDTLERHSNRSDLRGDWWRSRLVPLYGHRLAVLQQSASIFVAFDDRVELWPDADAHGWRGRPASLPDEHAYVLNVIQTQCKARLGNFKMDDAPLNGLRELTDLLAKERIAAVLVVMPEGPLLRSLYGPESDAPLLREFAAISDKHGFPLIQARAWFDEGMFRDSYHLNEEGAAAFTARLVREEIVPVMTAK